MRTTTGLVQTKCGHYTQEGRCQLGEHVLVVEHQMSNFSAISWQE